MIEETEDPPEPEDEDPGATQEEEWKPPKPEGEDPGVETDYADEPDDENRLDL